VILYADSITRSMKNAIDETMRRRKIQEEYNRKMNITPKTIVREVLDSLAKICNSDYVDVKLFDDDEDSEIPVKKIPSYIKKLKKQMLDAAKNLEFEKAAEIRDKIVKLNDRELTLK